jgi:hypothetical protein
MPYLDAGTLPGMSLDGGRTTTWLQLVQQTVSDLTHKLTISADLMIVTGRGTVDRRMTRNSEWRAMTMCWANPIVGRKRRKRKSRKLKQK